MIWLLVGYMWLFIHRPFEVWPWMGDLHIERVYMIATIAYWMLFARKTWTSNRATWGIGFLALAIVLATLFSHSTDFNNGGVQEWFKVLVFCFLVMSSVNEERDLRILIVAFIAITGLYELHSLREYLCGRGEYRMGTWRMNGVDSTLGDPNSFAASVNYAIPMLLPALALARTKWHYRALAAAGGLACLCVFLTGSRTGFAGLVALAAGAGLLSKYRWRVAALVLLGAPLIWLNLGDELRNRYTTLIDPSVGPHNAQSSADSREVFFWKAVDIWKENPIFGVGPHCFGIASGTKMQAHSLYAQTLSELGSLGVLALVSLVLCYFLNYFEARRIYRAVPFPHEALFCYRVVQATAIIVLQLLFLGVGGHNLFRFTWLWNAAFAALALRFLKDHYYDGCIQEEAFQESELLAE